MMMMSELLKRMAINWLMLYNITGGFGHHTSLDRYKHQLMEEKDFIINKHNNSVLERKIINFSKAFVMHVTEPLKVKAICDNTI
jgi:hypothetical protein